MSSFGRSGDSTALGVVFQLASVCRLVTFLIPLERRGQKGRVIASSVPSHPGASVLDICDSFLLIVSNLIVKWPDRI